MTVIDKYEYERILHTEEGRQEGLEQGLEQGSEKTKIEMIKSMYKNGITIEKIAKIAEMNTEEIEKLVESIKETE